MHVVEHRYQELERNTRERQIDTADKNAQSLNQDTVVKITGQTGTDAIISVYQTTSEHIHTDPTGNLFSCSGEDLKVPIACTIYSIASIIIHTWGFSH